MIGRRNLPGTGRGFSGSYAPDYGCAAYDERVDAAVRAGAVLFPKRPF